MTSLVGFFQAFIFILVGSMIVTGVSFMIPVLKYVNSSNLPKVHYSWAILAWLFGLFTLVGLPILHFFIAIPLIMWGFVYATKEWFICVLIGCIVLGAATIYHGGI